MNPRNGIESVMMNEYGVAVLEAVVMNSVDVLNSRIELKRFYL